MERPQVSPTEIRFHINNYSGSPEYLERIARIISYHGQYSVQTSGYQYMIGTSNDWWMDFDDTKRELIIAYRYGNLQLMQSLREVLIDLLGVGTVPRKRQTEPGKICFFVATIHVQDYLKRIASIIDWDGIYCPADRYEYVFGKRARDWSMSIGRIPNEIVIKYSRGDAEFMEKLRLVLFHLLDIERFNR